MVEVPSTAPLHGVDGIQSSCKLRFIGWTTATNSSNACSKASKKLDVSYDKLKAMLFFGDIEDLGNEPEFENIPLRV
jgi:hypothetical protein